MVNAALPLLAQLPEAYRAFGPLVDTPSAYPGLFPASGLCVAGLGGFPLITAQANCGSDSMRRQRLGS